MTTREVLVPLSARETEVLRALLTGLSTAEIGATLFISGKTVEAHMYHVRIKLGLLGDDPKERGRLGLIRAAIDKWGLRAIAAQPDAEVGDA